MKRMRGFMLLSGLATVLGMVVVIGVIGYRVLRGDGSVSQADVTALLPRGARIVQTGVAGNRIVVTIETSGGIEIRTFDLQSLRAVGRLRFANEP